MAAVKKRLGFIPCPCCGHSVAVRENEAGTLTISCDGCDLSAFAKAGTEVQAKWRAALPAPAPGTDPKEESQKTPGKPDENLLPPIPGKPPKAKPFDPLQFLKGA